MKKIGIMTDSHSGISREDAKESGLWVLPMPFYMNDACYYEELTLSRETFFQRMAEGIGVSTSQPSPESVMNMWDEMLKEYEQVLYLPMSSGLSGSCSTACVLASDEKYEGKVFVVDNGRVSTPLYRSILDAKELVEEGYDAEKIREILEKYKGNMVIYLGVNTLEYLKKGGRLTPAAAAFGTLLNIKPVLKLDVGALDIYQKCRGFGKAKKIMLEAMHRDLETTFKEAHERGELYLLAASSATPEATEQWVQEIKAEFPGMEVLCGNLSLGICCHTGPGALGIGWSQKPARP